MEEPRNQISSDRKALYYIGMVLVGVGFLLFISTFFSFGSHFGDSTNFEQNAKSDFSTALIGMILVIIGGVLRGVGAKGLAGSGVVLDPEQAREDVEPWARMAGGVVNDALSEVDAVKKVEERLESPATEVKIRCRNCQALNDESAKFCNQCGSEL